MEDRPYLQGYLHACLAYIELGKGNERFARAKGRLPGVLRRSRKNSIKQLDEKNPMHTKVGSRLHSSAAASPSACSANLAPPFAHLPKRSSYESTSSPDEVPAGFLTDAYYRRGICFHLIGEDKMAISDFQTAAHLDPTDPRANLWEGFTYAKLGDYHQALRAYGDAIAASDRYTPAYYNRGLTYMMLGEYNKAISDFNDAIRLDPANAEYYFKRGIAYQQLGDNQKASESFSSAIEFDKNHAGAYRHMAEVMQSIRPHRTGRPNTAKRPSSSAPQKK